MVHCLTLRAVPLIFELYFPYFVSVQIVICLRAGGFADQQYLSFSPLSSCFRHIFTRKLGALCYDIKFIRLAQEIFMEDFSSPSFQHLLTQGYKAQT